MSTNLPLINDIKKVRENKEKELIELEREFEKKKEELQTVIVGYDKVIRNLEHGGGTAVSYVRKNIDSDLLRIFEESAGDFGITPEESFQYLKNKGVKVSLNTVSNRIKDWEKEGKIFQKNAPAKRNRRYILKKDETMKSEMSNNEVNPSVNVQS